MEWRNGWNGMEWNGWISDNGMDLSLDRTDQRNWSIAVLVGFVPTIAGAWWSDRSDQPDQPAERRAPEVALREEAQP